MPDPKSARNPEKATSIGWVGAMLSGLALVTVAVMLVILFGFLDALHFGSVADFFTPDSAAAAGTLALVGGAEGVTLSIVLLGVMFGIQTSSSRYSPRIIGIFTRNPLNALVLSFALASILYTFLVRSEIKPTFVPMASVAVAEVRTAKSLSPDEMDQLAKVLGKKVGKRVELDVRTDPSLLAGFVAKIGSEIYDASVLRKIDRFRESLA